MVAKLQALGTRDETRRTHTRVHFRIHPLHLHHHHPLSSHRFVHINIYVFSLPSAPLPSQSRSFSPSLNHSHTHTRFLYPRIPALVGPEGGFYVDLLRRRLLETCVYTSVKACAHMYTRILCTQHAVYALNNKFEQTLGKGAVHNTYTYTSRREKKTYTYIRTSRYTSCNV